MNRRSFIASMAAAFGTMATGIRLGLRDVPPNIDYSLFCGNMFQPKYDIDRPFNIGDSIYATNCHVIVTHPGEWSGESSGKLPNIALLPWESFESRGWKMLGDRYEEIDRGDGCMRLRIGSGTFDADYIERIRTLGNLEYRLIPIPYKDQGASGDVDSMLFRGSHGIKGILMGMN